MHSIIFAITAFGMMQQTPLPPVRTEVPPVAPIAHAVHPLWVPAAHAPLPPAVPAHAVHPLWVPAPHAPLPPAAPLPASVSAVPELPPVPEPHFPQDPADSLWRAARMQLDAGNARAAAQLYNRLATEQRYANSQYRPHALYWEAFSRQRIGGASELQLALETLGRLRSRHPDFENMVEVDRLESRLNSALASSGNANASVRRAEQLAQATAQCPDQEIRVAVVEALISMPAEQAMPTLRQVMARRDECSAPLREKAVFIISQKHMRASEDAVVEDLLLDAVRNDPDAKVREQALFWLSQVPSEKAVEAIESMLRTSSDPRMVERAVFALSQQRSPRALPILRDLASRADAPKEARKHAIFWLGQHRNADIGFLRDLYGSLNDADLKEAVLFALSQRRGEDNSDFLFEIAVDPSEPMALRKHALFWAGQQRALPLNRLGDLYSSMQDREMREQVIFTISQRREPEAIDRLIDIVRTESDVELRKKAIFWLGQSKDPRAASYLAELISG